MLLVDVIITNKYLRKLVWGIGFALFCLVLALLYSYISRKQKTVVLKCCGIKHNLLSYGEILLFIIMTVFASIRLNVGSDFYNYYNRFNNISKNISLADMVGADGFGWLSFIIKQFTDFEYAIFGVIAFLLYGFLFRLIKNEVKDVSAAFICYLFMGFFANSLNILKQCMAMMFVFSFYKELMNKNFIMCILFGFLAFLFHYSAIFALVIIGVVYFFKIKPSRIFLCISIFLGISLVFFLPQFIKILINYVPSASGYEVYVNWRRGSQFRLVVAVTVMSIIYTILLWIIVKNRNLIKSQNYNRYFEISFLIIGLCINIASIRIWVVQRIALYFYQFLILILPTMFQGMSPIRRRISKQTLYLIMFLYLIFSGIFWGENEYYSYSTIFSGDNPIYDAEFNKMFK